MEQLINVHFNRKGGYPGFNLAYIIPLKDLKPQEAEELRDMINQSGIINHRNNAPEPEADLFTYFITLEGNQKQTIIINQKDVLPQYEPVIQYLSNKAKEVKSHHTR